MSFGQGLLIAVVVAVVVAAMGPLARVSKGQRWSDGVIGEFGAGFVLFVIIVAWQILLDALHGTAWAAILIGVSALSWWVYIFRKLLGR
jgi:hypothetical protein